MTRLNCIAWLLLSICAAAVAPASGQTKVKTSVEKGTLFIDGAQVTRTKQIDLPAGNSTLVFTGLSPYLDEKCMQVAAKGRFTVTAVNRLFNHTDSLERSARQKALEQELGRIRLEQQQQKAAGRQKISGAGIIAGEGQNGILDIHIGQGKAGDCVS